MFVHVWEIMSVLEVKLECVCVSGGGGGMGGGDLRQRSPVVCKSHEL